MVRYAVQIPDVRIIFRLLYSSSFHYYLLVILSRENDSSFVIPLKSIQSFFWFSAIFLSLFLFSFQSIPVIRPSIVDYSYETICLYSTIILVGVHIRNVFHLIHGNLVRRYSYRNSRHTSIIKFLTNLKCNESCKYCQVSFANANKNSQDIFAASFRPGTF